MSTPVRERLIDTACRLFYEEGIRAIGVDRVVKESGVAKMSLYQHFSSKDDLVAAYLARRHDRWVRWFEPTRLEDSLARPEGVEEFFERLDNWIQLHNRRGCPFINAAAELAHPAPSVREIVSLHRRYIRDILAQRLVADGLEPTETLISKLALLMDGALVGSQLGNPEATRHAREMAGRLVEAETARTQSSPSP